MDKFPWLNVEFKNAAPKGGRGDLATWWSVTWWAMLIMWIMRAMSEWLL